MSNIYTGITAEQAESLAVSYHAFLVANEKGDSKDMAIWAKSLINAQRETGINLLPESNLEFWIRDYRENFANKESI